MNVVWRYADHLEADRISRLRTPVDWRAIMARVVGEAALLCTHEGRCTDNVNYYRVEACLAVSPDTFDIFFNGRTGYRGLYFDSADAGGAANHSLIAALAGKQLDDSALRCVGHIDGRRSLAGDSAKVWLAEVGKGRCDSCRGEWRSHSGPPDISNDRWEHSELPNAQYGRTAPKLSRIRLFGAFIDSRGSEWVPPSKVNRAAHIHLCGWS
jgi:hypothetical protein